MLPTSHSDMLTSFRGELIAPGDERYDSTRAVWNGMVDKRPALIARCAGASDVATAIRYARAAGLRIAVRGGGHNVAGKALCNDGLVVDLGAMRAVWIDPIHLRVRAQGGATLGDLDAETQAHGLAVP